MLFLESLAEFLTRQNIPCLYDVDTRAVTRKIRNAGTMKGIIVPADADQAEIDKLMAVPIKKEVVMEVTTKEAYTMEAEKEDAPLVVAMDFGVKQNILTSLHNIGCKLQVVPADTKAEDILAMNPDGIFLSNGPGDPADVPEIVEEIKKLIGKKPIFGICLGHQLIARALGAKTYKLKCGHRGGNHPVKDLKSGKVYISSQNHGYVVDDSTVDPEIAEVAFINVNDKTVEGLRYKNKKIFTVQFHPEACPGPQDSNALFDEFVEMMGGKKNA